MTGKMRNVQILIEKPYGDTPLGGLRFIWKDYINVDLKET